MLFRSDRLLDIARRTYLDPQGRQAPYLNSDEVRFLSIPKGTLDPQERVQIESHVVHTFNFLAQIPWTREIRNIPAIARAHHEKLDGSGYPHALRGEEIGSFGRMAAICDLYDNMVCEIDEDTLANN